MTNDETCNEIVWIKDAYRLVDAESYERTYGADQDRSLAPGYYIAQWPPGTDNPHFLHDQLTFTGPFQDRHAAAAALDSAQFAAPAEMS